MPSSIRLPVPMGDHHVHLHPHGAWNGAGPAPGEYPAGFVESFVTEGLNNGADEIGFTEHLYRCIEAAPVLGAFWEREPLEDLAADTEALFKEDLSLSLESYVAAVVDAKNQGLPVRLGLEVDFFPETIDDVLDMLEPYPFDFLIGSVHWIGGWAVDYPLSAYEFERRGIRQAYEDYFAVETELAASGAVDVLAHVDVVKKTGAKLSTIPLDLYEPVVAATVASDTAIELSSAGWHQLAEECYPSPPFLQLFADAGVPITLASDAHRPDQVARDRSRLIGLARAAGYTDRARFEGRVRHLVPLEAT